jgi:hypothetical protein
MTYDQVNTGLITDYGDSTRALFSSIGNIYYVSFAGSDSNDGLSVASPLKWPFTAMSKCSDDHGDVIIFLPDNYNQDEAATDYPGPFLADKRGVTLMGTVGCNPWDSGEILASIRQYDTAIGTAAATVPALTLQKPCKVMNLELVTDHATLPALFCDDSLSAGPGSGEYGGFNFIYNCRFVGWGICFEGIKIDAAGYNRIENCVFEDLTNGIHMDVSLLGNPTMHQIYGNTFRGCTIGILSDAAATPINIEIVDNEFYSSATTAVTSCISLGGAYTKWMVTGNKFMVPYTAIVDVTWEVIMAAGTVWSGNTYLASNISYEFDDLHVDTEQSIMAERTVFIPEVCDQFMLDYRAWLLDVSIAASGATLTIRLYQDDNGGTLRLCPTYTTVITEGVTVASSVRIAFGTTSRNWRVTIQSSVAPTGGAGTDLVKFVGIARTVD